MYYIYIYIYMSHILISYPSLLAYWFYFHIARHFTKELTRLSNETIKLVRSSFATLPLSHNIWRRRALPSRSNVASAALAPRYVLE